MIEAAMIWNEPNNKSHWDLEADPSWSIFSRMASLAGAAIAAEAPRLPRVLGGMSPIRAACPKSMPSPCTGFLSTGTCGKSTSGRRS